IFAGLVADLRRSGKERSLDALAATGFVDRLALDGLRVTRTGINLGARRAPEPSALPFLEPDRDSVLRLPPPLLDAAPLLPPLSPPLAAVAVARGGGPGEGGCGVAPLAPAGRLGRPAALKVLKGSGERMRRFLREAAILARLDPPGIPPLYDAGRTASGDCF